MKKLKWDESRLNLLLKLTNLEFPDNPVKDISELKKIIRKQELLEGITIEEHNRQELELQIQDYVLE